MHVCFSSLLILYTELTDHMTDMNLKLCVLLYSCTELLFSGNQVEFINADISGLKVIRFVYGESLFYYDPTEDDHVRAMRSRDICRKRFGGKAAVLDTVEEVEAIKSAIVQMRSATLPHQPAQLKNVWVGGTADPSLTGDVDFASVDWEGK